MHCHLLRRTIPLLGLLLVCHCVSRSWAVDLVRLTPANYDRFAPEGKEVDAIYGDWVLRNDRIVAVIAAPVAGRNANMTVRGVGGMLIDMTTWDAPSDQLSCFYPAGGRYLFTDASQGAVVRDGGSPLALDGDHLGASEIRVSVTGNAINQDGTTATVTYTLRNGQDWIDYEVTIHNPAESPVELPIEDMLRCDGNLFRTGTLEDNQVFFAEDRYFGQCYGIQNFAGPIAKLGGRNMQLRPTENPLRKVTAAQPLQWQGVIACSQGLPGIRQWATSRRTQTGPRQLVVLNISDILGPVDHAVVELWQDGRSLGTVQSNDAGRVALRLLPDRYRVQVRSHGVADAEFSVDVGDRSIERTLELPEPSRVAVEITDGDGRPIPAKVQFIGIDGTTSPDFGPDSAISAIKNAVYTAHGQFTQRIDPGTYRVIASHGPEYDAATMTIEVAAGQQASVRARLPRVVDTSGWVSADFHSHSSPSGDNVSHQTGRVLNLLAEHIEFAPCTEHNRIDTYVDNLQELGATQLMATCSGMELTGNPLPINHQNAFPLKMHLHHQDGGGPQTDADPVKQIERLALWDNSADKVVQSNHPNIPQMLGDRDLDGKPDEGFRGMFGWMDVIEVHPPHGIFTPPPADVAPEDKRKYPIFFWMQLLNLGYRIPGVVNTDAHYNFHGSGWYRNYLHSSTDVPADISIAEMIESAEHGRMIMTTGPFLEVQALVGRDGEPSTYGIGDDVPAKAAPVSLRVGVQCPNWFDVNRVQVFANGRPVEQLNFTRKSHPTMFSDRTVRFESVIDLPPLKEDTHVIVAAIGEGLKLGPVMGPERSELPPVSVSNPIFIDVDDENGFQPNGDDLGVPFMLAE